MSDRPHLETANEPPLPAPRYRLLGGLARMIRARPGWVLWSALILAALGGVLAASNLELDADTNSLIGRDRPFMKAYRAFMEEFGDREALYVVVDAGDPADPDSARQAVDQLAGRLRGLGVLPFVHATIANDEQWRLAPRSMDLERLRELLEAEGCFQELLGSPTPVEVVADARARLERLIRDGTSMEARTAGRLFAESVFLLEAVAAAAPSPEALPNGFELAVPRPTEYLVSSTGRMHFIEIMPEKDFGSMAVIREPLRLIRREIAEVARAFPGVEIGLTGKPVLQADELATTERDMTLASLVALAAIAVLFMVVFREVRRPLFAVVAFAAAFGWTYGCATLLVGRLNLLSMVFMLVLVGAGLDYGVHVIARWIEARRNRRAGEAVEVVMRTAVVGNTTGALTSAGVFLLALFTSFQGLRELGTIAGVGLLLCALAMTVVLPALLFLSERGRPPTGTGAAPPRGSPRGVGSRAPGRRRPALVLVLGLAICGGASVVAVERLGFESNLLELQADGLDSVEWEHRLFEDDTSASWFAVSVVDRIDQIPAVVESADAQPVIGEVLSVLDLVALPSEARDQLLEQLGRSTLPPDPGQAAPGSADLVRATDLGAVVDRLRTLEAFGGDRIAPEQVRRLRDLRERLRAQRTIFGGGDEVAAVNLQTRISTALANTGNALEQMGRGARGGLRASIPDALRDRFVSPEGRFAVLMQPAENVWSHEPMSRFVEAIRTVDPDTTGVPITQYESIGDMSRAFLTMGLGAVLVVGVVLWLDFRSVIATACCMASLAAGLGLTLGCLALIGVSINLANFFGIPILIGLGADSAIHVFHRWRECRTGAEPGFGTTLRAVTLTACTTGIGFGALLLASHRGLQSLGWVIGLGSFAGLFGSTVFLISLLDALPASLSRRLEARI